MSTETYNNSFPVEPWTISTQGAGHNLGGLLTMFNDFYVYGWDLDDKSQIVYWNLDGTVEQRSLSSSGGDVEFEFYQPAAPPNSTVDWRIAVEDQDGNVETSPTESFQITEATDAIDGKAVKHIRRGEAWEQLGS